MSTPRADGAFFMAPLQGQATVRNDAAAVAAVDDCIALWTKMLLAEAAYHDRVVHNVKGLQNECTAMLEVLCV